MIETWNKFVYDLIESKAKNIKEEPYHALIETQLQLLGWAKYRKEILHKPNVPTGRRSILQPDIIINKDNANQFVIEVKRPVYSQTKEDVTQLQSYIRQLKMKVGIYIGEHIEIFYDKPGEKDAISITTIPLELNNKRGSQFVNLFSRDEFNEKAIIDFCEKRIEEKLRQENLNKIKESLIADAQTQITEALRPYLAEKYNGTFSEDEIQAMLSSLRFEISSGSTVQHITKPDEPLTAKHFYDYTEYSFNGTDFHKKNRFVLAVVKEYITRQPQKTYAEIEQAFPAKLQGSYGVTSPINIIRSHNYNGRRYFTKKDELLKSGDGITFAVCTEWSKNNLPKFISAIEKLGFTVTPSDSKIQPTKALNQTADIPCRLTRGGIDAKGRLNKNDKTLTLLKGSIINPSHANSFKGNTLSQRNKQIKQYTEERDGKLYVSEDVKFDTPSGAAKFCIGCSSNGWRDWKDENGNELIIYRS